MSERKTNKQTIGETEKLRAALNELKKDGWNEGSNLSASMWATLTNVLLILWHDLLIQKKKKTCWLKKKVHLFQVIRYSWRLYSYSVDSSEVNPSPHSTMGNSLQCYIFLQQRFFSNDLSPPLYADSLSFWTGPKLPLPFWSWRTPLCKSDNLCAPIAPQGNREAEMLLNRLVTSIVSCHR